MNLFQLIAISGLLVIVVIEWVRVYRRRIGLMGPLVRSVIWLSAIGFILFPDSLTYIARWLGIGVGANLLLYLLTLAFIAVSFLLYAQLLTRPVSGLADVYGQTQSVRGSLGRLLRALDEPPESPSEAGAAMPQVNGDIRFEGVSFGYPGRPPALNGIDLHIAAGETVALVGPNGAGKSTLAHLLMRLHPVAAGRILIDGVDIATVSLHGLRSQIGVVPQHVLLFNSVHINNTSCHQKYESVCSTLFHKSIIDDRILLLF